jgi:hypothetical protein
MNSFQNTPAYTGQMNNPHNYQFASSHDIEITDRLAVEFTFDGKNYEVDSKVIMNSIGINETVDVLIGGYDVPKYKEKTITIGIEDLNDWELCNWLFNNMSLWIEVKE